ncbi:ladderlectin [Cololabis saira]|uniref:ladderlectin n=1 Tax=Cololabis saira TaxID=129043 RepID=UPI002AD558B0|nr:ladderlectin [Cololabis saira]
MKLLGALTLLLSILSASRAGPINSTLTRHHAGGGGGLCDYSRQHCTHLIGAFCPECDAYGNFLPLQCSGSTGYCWCVDTITGEDILHTSVLPGVMPPDCGNDGGCPSGWSSFGHQCFQFIDAPKTWAEAEFYCQFDRANLASVHSYEENHFIQSLTRGDTHHFPQTWIGGSDAVRQEFWMWTDGSEFHYENWGSDDSSGKTERCLKMNYQYDLKWGAASCNDTLPFVCSKNV